MNKQATHFTLKTAEGVTKETITPYVLVVVRAHRDLGYYECRIISGGHPGRHGSLQIVHKKDILANKC